MNHCK